MKKLFLFAVVLLSLIRAEAQRVHLTLFGGVSNYQGDLQSKRMTLQQAGGVFGIGALYEISEKLYGRANVNFGKVRADDKISGLYLDRNLSFSSPVTEVHVGLEYDLLNSYEKTLVPFVFAGVAGFHFNPSTLDSNGTRVYLQPLGTEGQGFYQGRQKYSLTSFAIPFGGGLKFSLSENIRVRAEIGIRKTTTDYLDDVSTTYSDEQQLLLHNGEQAVDLAFRGDETKGGLTYPVAGSERGSPKHKDWYYFAGLGISFRLSPKFGTEGGGGKNKTGCPVNIY